MTCRSPHANIERLAIRAICEGAPYLYRWEITQAESHEWGRALLEGKQTPQHRLNLAPEQLQAYARAWLWCIPMNELERETQEQYRQSAIRDAGIPPTVVGVVKRMIATLFCGG